MSKSSLSATYTKNIAAGNSYAMSYAITPNTINKYYYFAGSDCANFTSQILEAMGVPQDRSGGLNASIGWWHEVVPAGGGYTHSHSFSFIRADTFVKYFHTGYTTYSHLDFSYNLLSGDIITYDQGNDGDWDHVGYVVTRDTYAGTYPDEDGHYYTYYNYFVAQHSGNYKYWTSSYSNDWEKLSLDGVKYGRIVR